MKKQINYIYEIDFNDCKQYTGLAIELLNRIYSHYSNKKIKSLSKVLKWLDDNNDFNFRTINGNKFSYSIETDKHKITKDYIYTK